MNIQEKEYRAAKGNEQLFKKKFPTRSNLEVDAELEWIKSRSYPRLAVPPIKKNYTVKSMVEIEEKDFKELDPENYNVFTLDTEGQIDLEKDSFMPFIIIGSLTMEVLVIDNRAMKVYNKALVQSYWSFLAKKGLHGSGHESWMTSRPWEFYLRGQ